MTKRRTPLSTEDAMVRIAAAIGYDAMAEASDRSAGHLRNCANPDRDEELTLGVARSLDLAYRAAGGTGYPIHESQAALLELAEADSFACRHELMNAVENLIKEGGEAHAALVRLFDLTASEADRKNAFREATEAFDAYKPLFAFLSQPLATSLIDCDVAAHQRAPP